MDYITSQGINAVIFSLIAFDTTDYSAKTHDELIAYIVDNMTGKGWALAGDTADVDLTAMAIQALAPYAADEKVNAAIDSGLEFLAESLDENARYANGSESTSQVLIALAALGIDPLTDSRFIVDGITLIDALESYATENGYSTRSAAKKTTWLPNRRHSLLQLMSFQRTALHFTKCLRRLSRQNLKIPIRPHSPAIL